MDDTTNNFNGFRVFNNKIKKFENIKDFEINVPKIDTFLDWHVTDKKPHPMNFLLN